MSKKRYGSQCALGQILNVDLLTGTQPLHPLTPTVHREKLVNFYLLLPETVHKLGFHVFLL